MGTPEPRAAVSGLLSCSILILAFTILVSSAPAIADPRATDRVLQFLTNAHTGRSMRPAEWLSRETRDAEKFRAFGGLDALIRQSTFRAHQFKGLKSIVILDVKQESPGYLVMAEVQFREEARRAESNAAAEREAMVWTVYVTKESGAWKLSM